MGGVFAREEVVAPIARAGDELMFFTFSAHPGACAAADAVLDILEREALVERAEKLGFALSRRLARLAAHPHVAEVRGRGLLHAVELVRDRVTLEPFPKEARLTARVVGAGLARGVFFYPGGCDPARDVILLGPPFVIGEAEIDHLVDVLEASIDAGVARATA
jgi:adenosylmethionine-8-amino-7-oxononanoate aminotransferase